MLKDIPCETQYKELSGLFILRHPGFAPVLDVKCRKDGRNRNPKLLIGKVHAWAYPSAESEHKTSRVEPRGVFVGES